MTVRRRASQSRPHSYRAKGHKAGSGSCRTPYNPWQTVRRRKARPVVAIRRQNNQQQTPQRSPAPTTPFLPEIWPRLEEGSLICKSRDDFVRYQTQIANGSSATTPGQALDCHTIRKQTGIQLLAHDGPSRTQIVTTDESKETWWTNSYLPSTPPPSVAKGPGAGK